MTEWIGIIARACAGFVFLIAAWTKLRSPRWSMKALADGIAPPVVRLLPAFEAVLGLALVAQLFPHFVAWIAVAVFCAFLAFVISRFNDPRGCNCFGAAGSVVGVGTVTRNIALIAVGLVGALF